MKNFDIEHLARKNPYKVSEDFFEKMQNDVLHKTTLAKTQKRLSISSHFIIGWRAIYATAAVLVLFFGLMLWMHFNTTETANSHPAMASHQASAVKDLVYGNDDALKSTPEIMQNTISADNTTPNVQRITQNKLEVVNTSPKKQATASTPPKLSDNQLDQIMSSFSNAEIADLSKGSEEDIYLDLFN